MIAPTTPPLPLTGDVQQIVARLARENEAYRKTIEVCDPLANADGAEIARLRAACERGGMGEWQPISTAPRDGTAVLLWDPEDKEPAIGRWLGGHREAECFVHYPSGWIIEAHHWMPLPEPPETSA